MIYELAILRFHQASHGDYNVQIWIINQHKKTTIQENQGRLRIFRGPVLIIIMDP
jgi:hypothetical protein